MDSDENDQLSDENTQNSLDEEVTGLRSKRLMAMIVCLLILFLLTFFILILNIMIITTLRMDPSGIKFLRFHHSFNDHTRQLEKTVEMAGERIRFDKVVTDRVIGFPAKDVVVEAPRMRVSAKPNDTVMTIGDKSCRFENVHNFQVLSSANDKTMFSARHPRVSIDKRIKKLAAEKIITNKIRSAVDEPLKIDGDNVVLRGNEQVRVDARNVNFEAMNRIVFNISRDGVMHMRGRVRLGDGSSSLPMSTSPSLSASLDGMRLCACAQYTHKLFVVPANKHCLTSATFCS